MLRAGVLDGLSVVAAPRTRATDPLAALGATVTTLDTDLLDEDATQAAGGPCDALVVDAAALFGSGGPDALRAALDGAWSAVRANFDPEQGTKVILLAPRPDAGDHAEALRAALENMARTLSIEWARYGVRITALAPGASTTEADLGELAAFLLSSAGDYYSGCRFDFA